MQQRPLRTTLRNGPALLRTAIRTTLRNMVMDDVVWLSYADLAARLGIGHESARQKVKRARWARRKDNTGTVMIGVPVEVVQAHDERRTAPERAPDYDPECGDNDPEHNPDPAPDHVTAVLVSHINRLERELESCVENGTPRKLRNKPSRYGSQGSRPCSMPNGSCTQVRSAK